MNNYLKINFIFIGVIVLIITYSVVFSASHPHPIHSFYSTPVISTGLSRAFSEIVRLNFVAAKNYNPYSLKLFTFFLVQLLMRVVFSAIVLSKMVSLNTSVKVDILTSVLLFLFCYGKFIVDQLPF